MKRLATLIIALGITISAYAEAPAQFSVSTFTFTRPDGWKQVEPKSQMRKAQLEVPGKGGGKSADVTFFFFGGGQGGDVQSNAQRWLSQFNSTSKEVQKIEPQEINGMKVTFVSTEGTMKASPISGITEDQPDSALSGAILEHAEGPVFVKMTGPLTLVKESQEKFMSLIKSATEKK
jgi:hypothetical protein